MMRRCSILVAAFLGSAASFCVPAVAQQYGIFREVYSGIGGSALSDLTNNAAFPNNPSSTNILTDFFDAPHDFDDNYGTRLRAFLLPPASGNYSFWVSSDDQSVLYLSTDELPANRVQIATQPSWNSWREWNNTPSQKSGLIALEGGRRYYVEALQKEGAGGDNLSVGWQLADGSLEQPIPATRTLPFTGRVTARPFIVAQPTNATVFEGRSVMVRVLASDPAPVSYQWQQNGVNLPGATKSIYNTPALTTNMSGVQYRCILTNAAGASTSQVATLTIIRDNVPPTLVFVQAAGVNNVLIGYSEPVQAAGGTNRLNYTISGGIVVSNAVFAGDAQTVRLTTSPMEIGAVYTLTVNYVQDLASAPNTIAANTQTNFTPEVFGVYREVFAGIGGSTIPDLTNHMDFPANPTIAYLTTDYFEAPLNWSENYGTRLRGLLVPPVSGNYTFWIASDDQSVLYLSSNENPANKTPIASVGSYTGFREWSNANNATTQKSASIALVAGRRYYLEALQKEGSGGDSLSVRWQLPSGSIEEPLPATRLVPVGMIRPTIAVQPTNVTVIEGENAVLALQVVNRDVLGYQWQRNDVNIAGATQAAYTNFYVTLADHQARYRCTLTNALGRTNSAEAVLTLWPDIYPPVIARVQNVGATNVWITFSERIEAVSGTNRLNYTFTNGPAVLNAQGGPDAQTIILTTAPLTMGSNYTLVVNQVRDRAATNNVIAPDSFFAFVAQEYATWAVGYPAVTGGQIYVAGGSDVTGGGTAIGGTKDQFQFSYQQKTGDFDVRVRLQGLSLSDLWAKAGLMARETMDDNSRFAAVLATPNLVGAFFEYRDTAAGASAISGYFPLNYPNLWLRLKRAGNVFTGYASADGQAWTRLGSVTLALSGRIYFGMVVTSHNPAQTATAQFREIGNVTGGALGAVPLPFEPLQSSSRRTSLVISEIMYHPAPRGDGRGVEFVEICNTQPFFEDISGYRLSGDVEYRFPAGTILPAGGFLVIARNPVDIQAVYGITNVVGPYTNNLSNKAGTVRLRSRIDAILLEVNYDSEAPWPVAPDGTGHSLVLARPSYGERDPQAWAPSDLVGGWPGRMDGASFEPAQAVVVNEVLANAVAPEVDFLELFNRSAQPVDVSGCFLSDVATETKFQIPPGTVIPARGFVTFDQNQLGFGLDADGEAIYFVNATRTRVLDALRFEGQASGVTLGRFPNGAPGLHPLAARTPGATNAAPRVGNVVINEIMYEPISGDDHDQFVELHNRGTNAVDLSHWRFSAGISYTFPTNIAIAANSYLVVAKNPARLLTNYPSLNPALVLGPFDQSLAGGGERLALSAFEQVITTNGSVLETNATYYVADEVTYGTGGRWGTWANGGGSSLELIDAHANHRLAPNWADSDETGKAPWTTVEATGFLDNGNGTYPNDSLQIILLGPGECLVDNIEVISSGSGNLVVNSTFEGGLGNWAFQGNHDISFLENTGGIGNSKCLHIRATGDGDTGANRIRANLSATIPEGSTATLRAQVRWLKGTPEMLLRLRGNWLEVPGQMALPTNLGTPGARNSRAVTNAGPAITGVVHNPALPAANQAVVVSARLDDPDGLGSVTLQYRIDPASSLSSVAMADTGAGGDAAAGDGIYSATIPGQAANTLVAFRLRITDKRGMITWFPADAPTRECLVRFGESLPLSSFGTYRFWITQASFDAWSNREKLSNKPVDATFVYGNWRVIYNAGALYSGSPYHSPGFNSPTGNGCNYKVVLPPDDRLLGVDELNKLRAPGNLWDDDTGQREKTSYWIADQLDLPINHQRFVNLYVNGVRRASIFEDLQVPNGDAMAQYYPDDAEGDLYKCAVWFEFADDAQNFTGTGINLGNYTTTGGAKKTARYRWTFSKRAAHGSLHNFTNVFNLVDAVNTQGANYTAAVETVVDTEEWMRVGAFEHVIGNWDSWMNTGGQNNYLYKPQWGKWQALIWDINIDLGIGGYSDGPTTDLFKVGDGALSRMYNTPIWRRAYWRALKDAADRPLLDQNVSAIMDARYAAFAANGLAVNNPSPIRSWIAQRRNYILSQLALVDAPLAITSNGGTNFSTANAIITLTGTAPVAAKTLTVNGLAYPVTWTGMTTWRIDYPLSAGTNDLVLRALDSRGELIANGTQSVIVTFTGVIPNPQDDLAINEILCHPAVSNTAFVELYNRSASATFDVSNWRLEGVDFTFAPGTVIGPRGYLLVVENRAAFAAAYGTNLPVAGEFAGKLDQDGETLKLVKPGVIPTQDVLVSRVKYDDVAPWPAAVPTAGASLQLIDSSLETSRVGNWAAAGGWRFAYYTGSVGGAKPGSLRIWPQVRGDFFMDDLWLCLGSVPESGTNLLLNTGFEAPFLTSQGGPWTVNGGLSNSSPSTLVQRSGSASLHLVQSNANFGGTAGYISQALTNIPINSTVTVSFWYLPPNATNMLITYLNSYFRPTNYVRPVELATPGAPNSVAAVLTPFPPLWINEVQVQNLGGPADSFAEHDPWVEIHNAGTTNVDFSGCYLTDQYTNLTRWAFPSNTIVPPGQFLVVWCDGQEAQSRSNELHTNFRLNDATGSVALVRSQNSRLVVLDYVHYADVGVDRSFGSFPDGQPFGRQVFHYSTPGDTNDPTSAPSTIAINEWMAANAGCLGDPADNDFDDWLELFNYGTNIVDLAGYYLTDDLTNRFQYQIPAGYTVPPGGFLLVWADDETGQNSPSRADLHANFQLSKNGEAIGLFAPDGRMIDAVTFPTQNNNVSQGRWPDGAASLYSMSSPTPHTHNTVLLPNTPPSLLPIPNHLITDGQLLQFSALAIDMDIPAQSLTFSLDDPIPDGAIINAQSGLFTWRPMGISSPATNWITVRVTDSGVPSLSAASSFSVVTFPMPRLTPVTITQNTLTLAWGTQPGKTYQVQFTDDLNSGEWHNLGEALPANGLTLTISDTLLSSRQRFYRVVQLD